MRPLIELLGDRFFELLEASAEEACRSVKLLPGLLGTEHPNLDAFAGSRRSSERITTEIELRFAKSTMASLKKEDIEALARALGKIPELVEQFAERFSLVRERVVSLDLSPVVVAVGKGAGALVSMVGQLRRYDNVPKTSQLEAQSQKAADLADQLMEGLMREMYRRQQDPLKLVMEKDLVDRMQSIVDHCRDCADLVDEVVLKYS